MESLENRPLLFSVMCQAYLTKDNLFIFTFIKYILRAKWKPVISREENQSNSSKSWPFARLLFWQNPNKGDKQKNISIILLHEDHVGSRRLNTVEIIYSEIASVNFNFEKAFNMDEWYFLIDIFNRLGFRLKFT